MSQKIAIVVQRYGVEINGGAELHARLLAEQLSAHYEVDVLTTTAFNYYRWANHYTVGTEIINGVRVKRFSTIMSSKRQLRRALRGIFGNKKYFKLLARLGLLEFLDRKYHIKTPSKRDIDYWFVKQGPYCPDLITYIKTNRDNYDAFIFFTYLYYPTAVGMRFVPEKSIFIPTAHDEQIMFTKPYEDIYSIPAFIMYNTVAEKNLVESNFKKVVNNSDIAGLGFSAAAVNLKNVDLSENMDLSAPFFVYIGRIDSNKGCDELISLFEKYAEEQKNVRLVMIGTNYMGVEENKNIILTGFVNDDTKNFLLKNSQGLIIPSKNESLSMVTLEAMAEGKTVIVNENCKVLKQHVLDSKTGFYYSNYEEFKVALNSTLALTDASKVKIAERAKAYVETNYSWDNIIEKFKIALQGIIDGKYNGN
ncbi:glycosyltransferase [Sphingobacterium olei]|uniref:Glycosyltransferase n=1 Tax=Sphingobacterium olei TaxID=2571155 RepID=A0A4U0P0K8_9SPHI|nr:glycosyltransferase [Sphingobacterium olei]TJZ60747.1 glycosyltransferase [Sphingobacterium olei]